MSCKYFGHALRFQLFSDFCIFYRCLVWTYSYRMFMPSTQRWKRSRSHHNAVVIDVHGCRPNNNGLIPTHLLSLLFCWYNQLYILYYIHIHRYTIGLGLRNHQNVNELLTWQNNMHLAHNTSKMTCFLSILMLCGCVHTCESVCVHMYVLGFIGTFVAPSPSLSLFAFSFKVKLSIKRRKIKNSCDKTEWESFGMSSVLFATL